MKNDPKDSSIKLLTYQLSNVRELDTIKYAFVSFTLEGKPEIFLSLTKESVRFPYTKLQVFAL